MKKSKGAPFMRKLYLFGAVVLIFTAIFFKNEANEFRIVGKFGLHGFPEHPFRMIVVFVFVSLFMIYGYLRLKRWGTYFVIVYSFGLGIVCYSLLLSYLHHPLTGNLIWSGVAIIYFSVFKRVYLTSYGT